MPTTLARTHRHPRLRIAMLIAGLALAAPAMASVQWSWAYAGSGINATGTLTTADDPDANGFYQVTGISGTRNGDAISGLQATGTAIPGNDGYPVDNLIGADGSFSEHGIGYGTAAGTYANLFFASWSSPPSVTEFFTVPASGGSTELPVSFSLQRVGTVPEPAGLALFAAAGLAWAGSRRRKPSAPVAASHQ